MAVQGIWPALPPGSLMHDLKTLFPAALVAVGLTALATAAPVTAAPFDEAFAPAGDGGLSAAPASPRDGETLESDN